ncbi:hypothetical protein [Endozoicomonas euniceicola]|uniref:Phage tail protein n=1 Tax=Endozoicomonas euniceicola TaxID=1234143 RepID=A0ABY6GPB3_9GAMM|nr:hypothetical protein [Endozoicomonas euniceicola]UYM14259.1 hypothetical protein NX720_15280 [Endozoicomonas euniceicola]
MNKLYFDLDFEELDTVAKGLGATEVVVKQAYNAALTFTARKLSTLAARALQKGLDIKAQKFIRKRLFQFKRSRNGLGEVTLWYGLNDMTAVAWGNPKQTAEGVSVGNRTIKGAFRAKVKKFGSDKDYKTGAFIRQPGGKRRGPKMLSQKTGRKYRSQLPIQLATFRIKDQAESIIEDDVLVDFEDIFMTEYERQLKWRMEKLKQG